VIQANAPSVSAILLLFMVLLLKWSFRSMRWQRRLSLGVMRLPPKVERKRAAPRFRARFDLPIAFGQALLSDQSGTADVI
jgi:hypothetical protein